ncbi:zinc-binding alcohol dehydrogenase-like protein [Martensiomyces pterosporus]|nr:zinc-binding alcohol dehydrogenase-like protein [Martensiomyces pterosporus]
MRAIVVKNWLKSPNDMEVKDVPVPVPKPTELLVKVDSTGANFFDILMVQGKYQIKPPFPFTPGAEFSGTVVSAPSAGSKDAGFKPGDRVFGSNPTGAYAEYLAVPAWQCFHIPSTLSFEEAAGLYITYPTSYAALVLRADVKKGDWVLVHAAAGGVGIAAVQIAKALGARVIAAVGNEGKFDICRQQGADFCVNYREPDWTDKVLEITKGKGADVVYDPVGLVEKSLKCIAWNGRVVVVGFAAGSIEKIAANRILLKNIAVTGVHWGAYLRNEPERVPEVWGALFKMAEEGKIKPVVWEPIFYGLDKTKDALRAIANRETYGKVIVKPSESSPKL